MRLDGLSDLTIILPLKDRAELTKWWLRNNIKSGAKYLVLDGSLDDQNERIFSELSSSEISYVRCPPDKSIEDFVAKMHSASDYIKTKYVMTVDNDDFINFDNITHLVSRLKKNPSLICADAGKFGFRHKSILGWNFYSIPTPLLLNQHNELNGLAGLIKLSSRYRYLWYGVFTIDAYRKIWGEIKDSKIENVFLIEMMHSFIAPLVGRCFVFGGANYFRMLNPPSSTARTHDFNKNHVKRIYFDKDYRHQVNVIAAVLADMAQCKLEVIEDALEIYYYPKKTTKTIQKLFFFAVNRFIFLPGFVFRTLVFIFGHKYVEKL
jgi:glycosyltransferase domain-containing protein